MFREHLFALHSISAVATLMRQWKEIKAQYPTALLLFHVGEFYEAYNEDSKDALDEMWQVLGPLTAFFPILSLTA